MHAFYPDGDTGPMIAFAQKFAKRAQQAENFEALRENTVNFLAISGGADDGAYGAGYLVGWSARGDRPKFQVVTGTSTGALTAPFVFLGSKYDAKLRALFTKTTADHIYIERSPLAAFGDDALVDTTPLRELIAANLTPTMVREIAAEYAKGRLLLIGTTNLDQGRSPSSGTSAQSPQAVIRMHASSFRHLAGISLRTGSVSARHARRDDRRQALSGNACRRRHSCAGFLYPRPFTLEARTRARNSGEAASLHHSQFASLPAPKRMCRNRCSPSQLTLSKR